MIADRERRALRAMTRLACAAQLLETAAIDAGAVRESLGEVVARERRRLEAIARELGRELESDGETKGQG